MCAGKPLDSAYVTENVALVEAGCANLVGHVKNTKSYGVNVVVAVNRFSTDTDDEIGAVRSAALAAGAYDAVVCTHHAHGGKGAVSFDSKNLTPFKDLLKGVLIFILKLDFMRCKKVYYYYLILVD